MIRVITRYLNKYRTDKRYWCYLSNRVKYEIFTKILSLSLGVAALGNTFLITFRTSGFFVWCVSILSGTVAFGLFDRVVISGLEKRHIRAASLSVFLWSSSMFEVLTTEETPFSDKIRISFFYLCFFILSAFLYLFERILINVKTRSLSNDS